MFRVVVNRINKRVPVIAGTGSNNTADSVKMTKMAEAMGVDGALIVGPYYNKPTQEGFYQHFAAVAQSTGLPIIVYNVPGRTASNISPAIVARLAADLRILLRSKKLQAMLLRLPSFIRFCRKSLRSTAVTTD